VQATRGPIRPPDPGDNRPARPVGWPPSDPAPKPHADRSRPPCPPPDAPASRPEGQVIPGLAEHGGAYSTSMEVAPDLKLVAIFLAEHAGYPGDEGLAKLTFTEAFRAAFGK